MSCTCILYCADIDECATQTDNCHVNAECTNTDGSFVCTCIVGYEGDGVTCTGIIRILVLCTPNYINVTRILYCADTDECATQTDNCHVNAECTNTDGSFVCTCIVGYDGDGETCTGIM